jgi:hypothetical protein
VGRFPKEEGTNPKADFLCECCSIFLCWVVLYGSVQSIQQEGGRDFQGNPLARKLRWTFGVFLLLLGHTVQVVQHTVGHVFRGTGI